MFPHNNFLISPQNIHCGYSIEVPLQSICINEYPQHRFHEEIRKKSELLISQQSFSHAAMMSGCDIRTYAFLKCHLTAVSDPSHTDIILAGVISANPSS